MLFLKKNKKKRKISIESIDFNYNIIYIIYNLN